MSPSKKLFIAATLVAMGYGVAAMLGAPNPRLWRDTLAQADSTPSQSLPSTAASKNALFGPANVGSVRLLPDAVAFAMTNQASAPSVTPELHKPTTPPELAATFIEPEDDPPSNQSAMLRPTSRLAPSARLKKEAPRPLPSADKSDPICSTRQVNATNNEPYEAARPLAAIGDAMSAEFASETILSALAISATTTATPLPSTQPVRPPAIVNRPPWSVAEDEPLRSHVIVDGDSLAKLAGRYLDDPRRSDEIFALNRGVLSDPDILPIGLELKIPSRDSTSPISAAGPLSRAYGRSTLHAAANSGLVPVRLPPTFGVAPRAELLPPTPVQ